jgi:hypothetical protein
MQLRAAGGSFRAYAAALHDNLAPARTGAALGKDKQALRPQCLGVTSPLGMRAILYFFA